MQIHSVVLWRYGGPEAVLIFLHSRHSCTGNLLHHAGNNSCCSALQPITNLSLGPQSSSPSDGCRHPCHEVTYLHAKPDAGLSAVWLSAVSVCAMVGLRGNATILQVIINATGLNKTGNNDTSASTSANAGDDCCVVQTTSGACFVVTN